MISQVPKALLSGISEELEIIPLEFHFASGGCINNGGRLKYKGGQLFLKWNRADKYPGMFEAELRGLELLASAEAIRIPKPRKAGVFGEHGFIAMEYLEEGAARIDFFEEMGRELALLHRQTSDKFGLDHHNYIGSLFQDNTPAKDWHEFFITRRLEPLLKEGMDRGSIPLSIAISFDRLFGKLHNLVPREKPALLHGDLWSGNFMRGAKGEPCLIDPAVYYGHREMDLAMTRLFGGFDSSFLDTYREEFPFEKDFEERSDLHNLYPLLVHVLLFGGGYLAQVTSCLRRFA